MKNSAAIAARDDLPGRHAIAWRRLAALIWLVAAQGVPAQSAGKLADDEADQYQRIAIEREQAQAVFEQRQWECSQRFVVTSCVNDARAERRRVNDALNRREAALDSARRQARADKRLAIIKQKTEALAKLQPLAETPQAASRPPAAEPKPSTTTRNSAASRRDNAAAEAAAAQRAQASQQRREQARQQQLEREARQPSQKAPAAPLPTRPLIPPAKAASAPSR